MTEKTDEAGVLYLCATPIGNLEDITLRALRILREADLIAAEDTRHTKKLLSHYDIHTPVTSYHEHNKRDKGPEIIAAIKKGQNVALVSDAGMPGVSDPGQDLVVLAVNEGIEVVPVPGASASLAALVGSGLPTDRFVFEGFLPRVKKERDKALQRIVSEDRTVIIYESPHRVTKTLEELLDVAGDRNIAVTRELTKVHEQFVRGRLPFVLEYFRNHPPKGEFTIVLEGKKKEKMLPGPVSTESIYSAVNDLILKGLDRKEAIKKAALSMGLSKRDVYNAVLKRENKR